MINFGRGSRSQQWTSVCLRVARHSVPSPKDHRLTASFSFPCSFPAELPPHAGLLPPLRRPLTPPPLQHPKLLFSVPFSSSLPALHSPSPDIGQQESPSVQGKCCHWSPCGNGSLERSSLKGEGGADPGVLRGCRGQDLGRGLWKGVL